MLSLTIFRFMKRYGTVCRYHSISANSSKASYGPLKGIKVLDLTRILAGPFCTMLLSDLGAEVIKVEKTETGDDTRTWGPPFINSESLYFMSVNRNKKSIAVDYKTKDGKEIIQKLASKCDIFVENYVSGTLEKLGLGYEDLRPLNDKLIYCSVTGFGSTGPYSKRGGYDVIASGVGGLMYITGPEGGNPVKVGVALTDLSTGLYAKGAILAALLQRQQTGMGQLIQCNLLSSQVSLLTHVASTYLNAGIEAERLGSAHASIVPYQAFKTSDGWLVIGAGNNKLFKSLCERIGHPDLATDEQFSTNGLRVSNKDDLVRILSEVFCAKSTRHWLAVLDGSDLAYGPINKLSEVFMDPQVTHLDSVSTVQHPTAGEVKVLNPAVRYTGFNQEEMLPPPRLGEHTVEILDQLLKYDKEKIKQLSDSGCIGLLQQ